MKRFYIYISLFTLFLISCNNSEEIAQIASEQIITNKDIKISNPQKWINSKPLKVNQLLGENKIVLIDFWTYTCVNCLRTLPFLKEWDQKYKSKGLVIIGVHTPEFEFEKKKKNIEDFVDTLNLSYPIVIDNDYEIWDDFENRYWPAKYLFDKSGEIIYQHFGEGDYIETEMAIRKALTTINQDISNIPIGEINNQEYSVKTTKGFFSDKPEINESNKGSEKPYFRMTRELYMGYERNFSSRGMYSGQEEYYEDINQTVNYLDEQDYKHNRFYLNGLWKNGKESIIHERDTESLEDYIALKFLAKSVNVVSDSNNKEYIAYVKLNDKFLSKDSTGKNIEFDDSGRSFFRVNEPKMYSLIILTESGEHTLKIYSKQKDFSLFAFTFGNYKDGF